MRYALLAIALMVSPAHAGDAKSAPTGDKAAKLGVMACA